MKNIYGCRADRLVADRIGVKVAFATSYFYDADASGVLNDPMRILGIRSRGARPVFSAIMAGFLLAPVAWAGVCPFEKSYFKELSELASATDADRVTTAEQVAYTASDGNLLGGYLLRRTEPKKICVLVFPGNAMTAKGIVSILESHLKLLPEPANFDVLCYDYRGYGDSAGIATFKQLFKDCRELAENVRQLGYDKVVLYGISMGGMVVANAMTELTEISAAVFDSVPGSFPWICDNDFDPFRHYPEDLPTLLMYGSKDMVISQSSLRELADVAPPEAVKLVEGGDHAYRLNNAGDKKRIQMVDEFIRGL